MCRVPLWAVLLSCMFSRGVAFAQDPARNWAANAAVSLGAVNDHCDGCQGPRVGPFDGWAVRAGLDRGIVPGFRLGLEGMRWDGEHQDLHRRLTLLGPTAVWYPWGGGLRLDAGVAWFHYSAGDLAADGVTFQAGLSWEVFLNRGLRAGPFIRYFQSAGGGASIDGQDVDLTIRPRMRDVGVRVTLGL